MRNRMTACLGGMLLSVCAGAAPPAPRAVESAPTTDQVYASFEDADYPLTLRQIAAALAVKGDAAAAYDRHELLALRGETQIRLKNHAAAAAAFDDASRETSDADKAAVSRATAALLRRAKGTQFTPPAKKGAPAQVALNLADPADRKAAFSAMFEQSKPRVLAEVKAARQSRELPDMLDAFVLLRDLHVLELASTGDAVESRQASAGLAERARVLMERAVGEMADTVAKLEEYASRIYDEVGRSGGMLQPVGSGAVGLNKNEVALLRRIAADCDQVRSVAAGLVSTGAAGDSADELGTVRDDAAAVAQSARDLAAVRWNDYRTHGMVGSHAERPVQGQYSRPGTNWVQRPARKGNPAAGPRGVGTGGPR